MHLHPRSLSFSLTQPVSVSVQGLSGCKSYGCSGVGVHREGHRLVDRACCKEEEEVEVVVVVLLEKEMSG